MPVQAQEEAGESERGKRRVAQVLSNGGYRKISEARELLDAEDHGAAITLLEEVINGGRYSDYDKAKALQMRAFVHVTNDEYQQAIDTNRSALNLRVLDLSSELELMYSLANLYAYTEQYPQSIQFLEKWFQRTENPDAQAYFTAAQVYALSEDLNPALSYAERGMDLHVKNSETAPRESWYRLLLAIRLQLKLYREGSDLLETMLAVWPDKAEYYTQLNALYQELGREFDALLVLSVARQNGLLNKATQYERLLQMYRYHDYPYKGASLLKARLDNDEVSGDAQQWKTLGDSYAQAREWQAAKPAYLKAAKLSSTGDDWLLLCQTAYRDGVWHEAEDYCAKAIDKGGLDNKEGYAWQILAMAYYHGDERQSAMDAFQTCSAQADVEEACSQWLAHIKKQIEQEELEEQRHLEQEAKAAQQKNRLENAVENALYFQ